MNRSTRNGFTLIELLVVIAIIAILAAILFPIFARAKETAASTKCLNNLKQIGTSLLMYTDDNGGRFPSYAAGLLPSGSGARVDLYTGSPGVAGLAWRLRHYTKNVEMWMCPRGARREVGKSEYTVPPGVSASAITRLVGWVSGPGVPALSTNYLSWQFNRYTEVTGSAANAVDPTYPDCAQGRTLEQYKQQAGNVHDQGGNHFVRERDSKLNLQIMHDGYCAGSPYFYPHRSGLNRLYSDGHAAWVDDARNPY